MEKSLQKYTWLDSLLQLKTRIEVYARTKEFEKNISELNEVNDYLLFRSRKKCQDIELKEVTE